jgi:hypothetical protein
MLLGGAALAQEATDPVANDVDRASNKVGQSVEEGRDVIRGQRSPLMMGELNDGRAVKNTLTTSATGLFLGQGLNAAWERSFSEKFSGVLGANFSRTRTVDGALTAFGAMAGVDWFIIGQYNEGLRLGPRLDVGVASDTVGDHQTVGSIGIAGELGYNWISTNGITAGLGAGLHGQRGGMTNGLGSGTWFPYGSVNVGYSW